MKTLPISNAYPNYILVTSMDNSQYSISVKWNTRYQNWIMDIATQDGDPIVYGLQLTLGVRLLHGHTDPRLPKGDIVVVAMQQDTDITRDNLGSDCLVVFIPEDELDV